MARFEWHLHEIRTEMAKRKYGTHGGFNFNDAPAHLPALDSGIYLGDLPLASYGFRGECKGAAHQ